MASWQEAHGGRPPEPDRVVEADIDWRRWAWVLWRRKWWIIAATVLGTALSIWSARGYKPVFQAQAMVWVEAPERGRTVEITNVFSTAGWIDLLRSYAVLDAVVHDLKLYLSPARATDRPLFQDFQLAENTISGAYKLIVRLDNTYALLDGEGNQLQITRPGEPTGELVGFRWMPPASLLPPGREAEFSVRRPRDVAQGMTSKLEITMADQWSNFISLSYRGTDAASIASVLNAILDHFVDLAGELKRQRLTRLAGTLEEQLELAAERLRLAETRLQTLRVQTITLPDDRREQVIARSPVEGRATVVDTEDPVFDRYFSLQIERDVLRQDHQDLATILDDLADTETLDAMRLEAVPAVRTATSLMAALEERGRKEVEHRALLYHYTPEHNEVQRLSTELAVLERQTIPALVRRLMGRLSSRQAQLDAEIGAQTAELQSIPPRAIEQSKLERELALAEQFYNSLQLRYEETQVAEAATQPSVRIVDRASPPAYPVQDTARLKIVLGFVLSLGFSLVGVIGYARFVDRRLQYPDQVVEDLGLPVLGVVPNLRMLASKASKDGEVGSSAQARGVVESFRALRTQLSHGLGIQYPAVIAITSPSQGEGKSLITSNLALAFADPDRSTILVDADVRRGRLHRLFGIQRTPGLSDYLRGDVEPALIVNATDTPGLYFTPRGHFSEEVLELLDGEGIPVFLDQLKQTFDVILLDTPPLAAGVDAVMIGAHADAVVAVLRRGRTDLELARAKLDSYATMLGIPVVGAILNDVETRGPYRYYTYSYDTSDEGA